MPGETTEREFTFDGEETCKGRWSFSLAEGPDGTVVKRLRVVANKRPGTDKERGCLGHPRTIIALIEGRSLASLDVEALARAACVKKVSCGQALAECLRKMAGE